MYYGTEIKNQQLSKPTQQKEQVLRNYHFLEGGHIFEEDFQIEPIVRLLNPPRTVPKRRERLEEFELYWQMNLITYEPHGMNKQSEIEKARAKMKNRKRGDTKRK